MPEEIEVISYEKICNKTCENYSLQMRIKATIQIIGLDDLY